MASSSEQDRDPNDSTFDARYSGANGRGAGGGGGGGIGPGGGGIGDVDDDILADKLAHKNAMLKQEKWWQTTLQVSIPFFLAGIGTIGAGIILGRVEVSVALFFNVCYRGVSI